MKLRKLVENRQLTKKLIISVVLFSSAIALIISIIQLYRDYQSDILSIESVLDGIETVHLGSLTESVWTGDKPDLTKQLEGIINIPDIKFLKVAEQGSIIASVGISQSEDFIEKTYPMHLIYKSTDRQIGTLTVQATLKNVYQNLISKAIDIVVLNSIKTFLVSGFILYMIYTLFTRYLNRVADFLQQLTLTNIDKKLDLGRPPSQSGQNDEIDIVVSGISRMQDNLMQAIANLQENENRYRRLVESARAVPWEMDLSTWAFTYVGPQAISLLGYARADWYQQDFWKNHVHPEDKDRAMLYCSSRTAENQDHLFEYRMIDSKGGIVWIRDDVQVITRAGVATHLRGYLFDITAEKVAKAEIHEYQQHLQDLVQERTEELESTIKELESFSYSVSHDLRSPLRAIDGFSAVLLEDYQVNLDAEGAQYLNRIRTGCQHMGELIDGLLDLSRASIKSLHFQPVDLSNLCAQAITRFQDLHPERQVKLTIQPNVWVTADRIAMEILTENLLSNAWKYTNNRETAEIEFGVLAAEGADEVTKSPIYYVKDNGAGFESKYAKKLFSPFQRLHNSTEFEGTGIGLATVRRIVDRHSGRIWAQGEVDKGATFFFTLNETARSAVREPLASAQAQ